LADSVRPMGSNHTVYQYKSVTRVVHIQQKNTIFQQRCPRPLNVISHAASTKTATPCGQQKTLYF